MRQMAMWDCREEHEAIRWEGRNGRREGHAVDGLALRGDASGEGLAEELQGIGPRHP